MIPKYVAIDIETTGLDPEHHQILEFAAVAWTSDAPVQDLPCMAYVVEPVGDIVGSPYALSMNKRLLDLISKGHCQPLSRILYEFRVFLEFSGVTPNNKVHLVGANVGSFDLQFLKLDSNWPKDLIHYRNFEVGSAYATKKGIPSLSRFLVPDGLTGSTHEALYDARLALHYARNFIKYGT